MHFDVDLGLLLASPHHPPVPALERSIGVSGVRIRDFCIPVNPYFPPAEVMTELQRRLADILRYYPDSHECVATAIAASLSVPPDTLVLGNGSTELITWIDHLLVRRSLATPVPTFGRWTDQPIENGKALHAFPLRAETGFATDVAAFVAFVRCTGAGAAAICNPNNPTGSLISSADLEWLIDALADLDVVVIDESFLDFAGDEVVSASRLALERSNVIVLKSLGKNLGLHGVRAGVAITNPALAAQLRHALPRWNVNAIALELMRVLCEHGAAFAASRRLVVRDRRELERILAGIPEFKVFPSRANFVYVRLDDRVPGLRLRDGVLTVEGMLIRECGSKLGASSQFLRIAARPPEEQALLGDALRRQVRLIASAPEQREGGGSR